MDSEGQIWQLRDDRVAFTEADGEIVVLDVQRSTYLTMSPSAAELWRRLAVGASAEQLADDILARFEVDRATAVADVAAFLADLQERGFLELSARPA